jgi:hypothetical protein
LKSLIRNYSPATPWEDNWKNLAAARFVLLWRKSLLRHVNWKKSRILGLFLVDICSITFLKNLIL